MAGALPAEAQRIDIWIDAAAAHARPPGGATAADPATYALLGARLRGETRRGAVVELTAQGGQSTGTGGGAWVEGAIRGQTGGRLGSLFVTGRAEAFGLRYSDPFTYTAYGGAVQPEAMLLLGRWALVARGELTRGAWRSGDADVETLPGADPPATDGGLGVAGGVLEVVRGAGRTAVRLGVDAYRSHADGAFSGGYGGVNAGLGYGTDRIDLLVGARLWRTPVEDEVGYHVLVSVRPRPDLQLRAHVGRTVRDPLYATAGNLVASLGVSWRVGGLAPAPAPRVVEIGERVQGGRRVRFRIRAPDAESVALAGNFTGWEPRPMRRDGRNAWFLEVVLEPGLHHFAFVVDGSEWTVPEDAPGVADDGWGRKNASVVVEQ